LLLTAQIALCCVTVTAAFVSLRGLAKAMNVDVGFNPDNAVRTEFDLGKRLRELSIRVALGARGKEILWAALGRMLVLLATGSIAGILLGVAASQVLSAIVYQASAEDPSVLAAVAFTVLVSGCLAVAGPIRRALRVDPARLLGEE
jgi:predicted lysophospholipase L1 biosynthesis ABC-type transport system permease subunit